jgi:hypothetical protein
MYSSIVLSMISCKRKSSLLFLSQSTSPLNLISLYIQWMNILSNIVYDIQTMSTQSSKQCPNCKLWYTTQQSFKYHIRYCRRTNCEETLNNLGISAANPLLSNFTPGVETNVFQQSNLTQSYEDEYEDIQQIEGFVGSTFDSDSWVNNDEELKEDLDDITSLV